MEMNYEKRLLWFCAFTCGCREEKLRVQHKGGGETLMWPSATERQEGSPDPGLFSLCVSFLSFSSCLTPCIMSELLQTDRQTDRQTEGLQWRSPLGFTQQVEVEVMMEVSLHVIGCRGLAQIDSSSSLSCVCVCVCVCVCIKLQLVFHITISARMPHSLSLSVCLSICLSVCLCRQNVFAWLDIRHGEQPNAVAACTQESEKQRERERERESEREARALCPAAHTAPAWTRIAN